MEIEFLGKDKEGLGAISETFKDEKDLRSFLKAIEDASNLNASAPEKREAMLKVMMDRPKFRNRIKLHMPELYKEGLKAERGKGWKMSMKDIEKATNMEAKDILNKESGWMSSDGIKDLKWLLESDGLNFADALKVLEAEQTKADRQELWDKEGLGSKIAMSIVAPFQSEKLSKGEVPNKDDAYADIVMAPTTIAPWGKAAGLVTRNIPRLPGIAARGIRYAAEFGGPGMVEGALHNPNEFSYDDIIEGLKATGRNAGAGATIAGGSQFLKAWGSKSVKKALKDIEDALKETVYPEEVKIRLRDIRNALENNPEDITEADVAFLRNFDAMKKLGITETDLDKIGSFSKRKLDDYLAKLKADKNIDPNSGKTLFDTRESIRNKLDDYEKAVFDRNPGIQTFTDVVNSKRPNKAVLEIGYGTKAGLGPVKKSTKVYKETSPGSGEFETAYGSMEGHHLISGEPRYSLQDWINNPAAVDPNFKPHNDPYYPRPNTMDKDIEDFLIKNPEFKMAFDKGWISRQDIKDMIYKRIGTRALGKAFEVYVNEPKDKE